MSLTKAERAALPDDDFAVPGKRKLPMQDEKHVRMAWNEVARTAGLSADERSEARHRLMARAEALQIDTGEWSHLKHIEIAAMALAVPEVEDHPNRMPFSGVLTRVGTPSDEPPHGSGGRRVLLTASAAEQALPSLLGMAVDLTADLDGHDAQSKVGIITAAHIEGDEIQIEGFIYASDFPDEAARIRADKDVLGFSFEAVNVLVADPCADPLEIVQCCFTGAAILRKDKAAYQTTSLSASADQEIRMTPDEMKALLAESMGAALAPLSERLDKIENAATAANEKLEASKAVIDAVEPHAAALESCAAAMETAGIGCAADRGHVSVLKKMASDMRASAAMGKTPSAYRDGYYAGAERREGTAAEPAKLDAAAIAKAVEDAVKPLATKLDAAEARLTETGEALKSAETKLADVAAKRFDAAAEPARKTLSPAVTALLAKADLTVPDDGGKLSVAKVDEALSKAGLNRDQRLTAKTALAHAGALA